MQQRANLTDRAKRYRAQKNATGPRRCVLCGSRADIQVMHLDGNEDHGERSNLAYGCRSCNGKLSAAFKKMGLGRRTAQYNPATGYPTFDQYSWAVSNGNRKHWVKGSGWAPGDKDEAGAVIHATPHHLRVKYAKEIARRASGTRKAQRQAEFDRYNPSNPWPFSRPDARRTTPATGGVAYHSAKRKTGGGRASSKKKTESGYLSVPDEKTIQEGFKRGLSLREILAQNPGMKKRRAVNPSNFDRCVRDVKKKGGAANAYAVCTAAGTRKKNPSAASAEVFEEFHGFEPSEVITVTKKVHYHEHLAAAGKLTHLDVWGIDGTGHKISGFKGSVLAFNEDMNQLFIEGGDQSVNLADYGIRKPHEMETLGVVTNIGYHTNKTHLGDEGGEAIYVHKFRSTNQDGRHVVVKIARYPDLIYKTRDEALFFSGGSYEILAEGINK